MIKRIKAFIFFVLITSCPYFFWGDELLLKNGTEIYGEIKSRESGIIMINTGIELMKIEEKEIRRIEPGKEMDEDEKSGDTYFNKKDFGKALEYYEKAFLKNSKSRSLLNKILIVKKKIEEDLTVIKEEEGVSDVLSRVRELEDKVRKDDARNLLIKALEKFPDAEELYVELAKLYESENPEEYYRVVEILIKKWSDRYYSVYVDKLITYYKDKVYYYNQTKDYQKAEDFLFKAVPLSPTLSKPLSYDEYKTHQYDDVEKAALSINYCGVSPFLNLRDYFIGKYYEKIEKAFYDNTEKYYEVCTKVIFNHLKEQIKTLIDAKDFEKALDVMKRLVPISSDFQNLNSFKEYLIYKDDKNYQLSMINKWALENKELDIVGLASKELLMINPEDKKGWENIREFIDASVEMVKDEYKKGDSLELISVQYKELEKFKDLVKNDKMLSDKIEEISKIILNEYEAGKYYNEALKAFNEKRYPDAKLNCDYVLTNLGGTRMAEQARELEIKVDREIGYKRFLDETKNNLSAGDYYTAFDLILKIERDYKNVIEYDSEKIREMKYKSLDNIFSDQILQAQILVTSRDYLGASNLLSELVFKYSLYYEKPYWEAERFLSQCRENIPDKQKGKIQGNVKIKVESQYFPLKGVSVYIVSGIIEESGDILKIIKGRGYVDKDITNRNGKYEIKDLPMGDYSVIFYQKDKPNQTKIIREKILGNQTVNLDQNIIEL